MSIVVVLPPVGAKAGPRLTGAMSMSTPRTPGPPCGTMRSWSARVAICRCGGTDRCCHGDDSPVGPTMPRELRADRHDIRQRMHAE